jgi:hypothetical protein
LCQQTGSRKTKVKKIRRKRKMMEGTIAAGLALKSLVALIFCTSQFSMCDSLSHFCQIAFVGWHEDAWVSAFHTEI